LIDLDGTVIQADVAIPGAARAIAALRAAGIPFRFTTNTTRHPRSTIVSRLRGQGIEVQVEEVVTPPVAAATWLREHGARRISLLLPAVGHAEFHGFELDGSEPEYVVVGDLGAEWTFERLNTAFRALQSGARLVALHRNRYWDPGGGFQLDAGAFVAALEFATGQEAVLVGKPNPNFFRAAAAELGAPIEKVAVVGDDPESDVAGAHAAGCVAVLVRTGKFRGESSAPAADAVLDSIADLPGLLGITET
jgi:HAD superfamily hydrolase (TIGR01458 family)